jgi:hypothetical protein
VCLTPIIVALLGLPFRYAGQLNLYAKGITVFCVTVSFILLAKKFKKIPTFFRKYYAQLLFILIICVIYLKDAFSHISIGYVDSISSYGFIRRFLETTPENYQPIYAIYASTLVDVFNYEIYLNYLGSTLGISFIVYIIILLNSYSQNWGYFFVTILTLPFFVEVNKTIIGMTANSMSFYALVVAVIGILKYLESTEAHKIAYLIPVMASFLVTPVLGYYLILIVTFITITNIVFLRQNFHLQINLILSVVLAVFFYLANSFLSKFFYNHLTDRDNNLKLLVENPFGVVGYVEIGRAESGIATTFSSDPGLLNLTRIILTDIFSTSDKLRYLTSYVDLAGFIILLISFSILILSLRIKNLELQVLSISTLVFGISIMTGIFEFTYLKGRSGWYYLITTSLIFSFLLSRIRSLVTDKTLTIVFLFSAILNFVYYPIVHYRYHSEDIYYYLRDELIKKNPGDIEMYSDLEFPLLTESSRVRYFPTSNLLDSNFRGKDQGHTVYIAVLDFEKRLLDPVLSRSYHYSVTSTTNLSIELIKKRNEKLQDSRNKERLLISQGFYFFSEAGNHKIYVYSFNNTGRIGNQ